MNYENKGINPGIKILFGFLSCLLAVAFATNFTLVGEVGPAKYVFILGVIAFGLIGAILIASGIKQ